jgi:hypothetical protein
MNMLIIFLKMLFILICAAVCAVQGFSDNYEFFTRAIDDRDKQVDIYAAHTVILSKLSSDGSLIGFFMNSALGGESKHFLIASNVTAPYAVIDWRGRPTVICNDNASPFVRMINPSGERLLPFPHFNIAKYDYTRENLYFYINETLFVYNIPTLANLSQYKLGLLTDMFVTNKVLYLTYNCSGIVNTTCSNGFFNEFVISNLSLKIEIPLSLIKFIILVWLLKSIFFS